MTTVTYDEATRIYPGTDEPAVDRLDLDIGDGELLVLVGPSGSGKSTALRMLAGLEPLDAGAIRIGERDVSDVRPRDRDIAMVFQNYALYPQLSVAANMGFALKQQGVSKEERAKRVAETARILDLTPYLDRKPKHLSGGQRQRVAMGRAIVRRPAVYLMDEPLSNLDAKLRVQTRTEVVELQDRLGVTTVYVTHDQVEAMTMGDRVAVLKDGVLQQCAAPSELYHRPVNLFVAGFIGSPAMNLIPIDNRRPLQIADSEVELDNPADLQLDGGDGTLTLGMRPEALRVGDGPLRARIRTVEDLGSEVFVHLALEHRGENLALVSKMPAPFAGNAGDNVGLQIVGTTYLFGHDDARLASGTGRLRAGERSTAGRPTMTE
jgi:multiple sugar transport system ATP-binding protein